MIDSRTINESRLKEASSEAIEVCEWEKSIAWLDENLEVKHFFGACSSIYISAKPIVVVIVVYYNSFIAINTLKKSKARNGLTRNSLEKFFEKKIRWNESFQFS